MKEEGREGGGREVPSSIATVPAAVLAMRAGIRKGETA